MGATTEIIRALRASGLTQSEIARRTSIPQPRLSRWENGEAPESADDALRLHALHAELIGAEAGQPPVDSLPQALPPAPRPEDPAAPLKLMTPDEAALRVRDAYLNGSGVPALPQPAVKEAA